VAEIVEYCDWKQDLDNRLKNSAVDDLTKAVESLNIEESKEEVKEEEKKENTNAGEEGPIMGFHAVVPIKECPHCVPGKHIAPISEFKEITIKSPCNECDHTKENWICLKCKVIGCSRYVKSHMVSHYEKEKHPIALSFADFSYWCYECDSYVESKHLNHVKHFYPQKFGAANVNHLTEYAIIKNSKA
jgi:uncharacterized UBP type Zn finger protein